MRQDELREDMEWSDEDAGGVGGRSGRHRLPAALLAYISASFVGPARGGSLAAALQCEHTLGAKSASRAPTTPTPTTGELKSMSSLEAFSMF